MMLGMQSVAGKWRIGAVLLAGFLLRLVFLHFHPPISGDSLIYGNMATNMLRHHVYALTEEGKVAPTLIRLPGYPAFLAACFAVFGIGSYAGALWVQILLSLLDCCLLALLAARLMGKAAGWAALMLALTCPFTANYSVVPLTETWSLFCITLAFFSFERWTARIRIGRLWNAWLVPLGFALAFAVLLRPDRILLAAVVVPAMLWTGFRRGENAPVLHRTSPALAIAAAVALPLLLWGVRNWHVFHVIQPLAPKYANDPGEEVALGFQRWYRTWAIDYKSTVEVYWPYDGSIDHVENVPNRAFDDQAEHAETARLFAKYNEETSSTPDVDEAFDKLASKRIAENPLRYYVLLPTARLANMWLRPRTELLRMPLDWWNWRAHPGKSLFSLAYVVLNAVYLVLALVGFRRWAKAGWTGHRALAYAAIAFVLLRCALLMTLDNSEQRYTMECYPIVLLLASFVFTKRNEIA